MHAAAKPRLPSQRYTDDLLNPRPERTPPPLRNSRSRALKLAEIAVELLRGGIEAELADGTDGGARDLELHGAVQLLGEEPLRLQVGVLPVRIVLVGECDAVGVVGTLAGDVAHAAHL